MLLISKYGNGSEELVNGLERKLGIKLDEEYRKFLVKYNGGDTPNTHVGIRKPSENEYRRLSANPGVGE